MKYKKVLMVVLAFIIVCAFGPVYAEEISSSSSVPQESSTEIITEPETPAQPETPKETPTAVEKPTVPKQEQTKPVPAQPKQNVKQQPKQQISTQQKDQQAQLADQKAKKKADQQKQQALANKVSQPTVPQTNIINGTGVTTYKEETSYYNPEIGTKLRYPLLEQAVLSSPFGNRSAESTNFIGTTFHQGIDLAIVLGTPIVAAEKGEVVRASWFDGYGNCVDILHEDGMLTRYGHMSEINVKEGQKVIRGQLIGKVGSTGNSTGPHLHFEVRPDGSTPVDPLPYLDISNVAMDFEYTNVKLLLVDEQYVNKDTDFSNLNYEGVLFQLNERLDSKVKDGKTIIDLSEYYESGLLKNNPIKIQTAGDYKAKFTKDHKVELNKELTTSEIQLLIPSKTFSKTGVLTYINSDYSTLKSGLYEFNPLFDIKLKLGINKIKKDNIKILVNGKRLSGKYFKYEDGMLTIRYSCLYLEELQIDISSKKFDFKDYKKDVVGSINHINSFITAKDFNPMAFNSFIDECAVISSVVDTNIESNYAVPPYNKYNFKNSGEVLLDNSIADGYVSVPINVNGTKMEMDTDVDEDLYTESKPSQLMKIHNNVYNPFIYGEKLNISNKKNIKDGFKQVKFRLLDYMEGSKNTYFIVSYNVEGIGGYFGIQIPKSTED